MFSGLFDTADIVFAGHDSRTTTFTVTTTNDDNGVCDTSCSLREAISAANGHTGKDIIAFDIPGAGTRTISLTTVLPVISDPVVLDGSTQPGASGPCHEETGHPCIVLNGSAVSGFSVNGLAITAGDSVVRGLVINNFATGSARAIDLSGSGANIIEGNYLGTSADGTTAAGNRYGIWISSPDNVIGGATSTARNVISGNSIAGIVVSGPRTQVQGNYIGTNAAGSARLPTVPPDSQGIWINGGSAAVIGGTTAGARNVISGNDAEGVFLSGSTATIQGNYIGTNAAGTAAVGNGGSGVRIAESITGATIGGTSPAARNIISGNAESGIFIHGGGSASQGNVVQGNFIGTDATGGASLGNGSGGVALADVVGPFGTTPSRHQTIGGTAAGAGNLISGNTGAGVSVTGTSSTNPIEGNSISGNSGLGIDLDAGGVTPNDPGDGDTGANGRQNFPALATASPTSVTGTLDSAAGTYRIEVFSNPLCDASGNGEGGNFLGSLATSPNTTFTFTPSSPITPGHVVTATATSASGDTSEFSSCMTVGGAALTVTATDDANDGSCNATHCSLREAIVSANAEPDADAIDFNLTGAGPHVVRPQSGLPAITAPLDIDGTTQAGYAGTPIVRIDGSQAGTGVDGFTIGANGSGLRGLTVTGFAGSGVVVNANGTSVEESEIKANGEAGVHVESGTGNTVTDNSIHGNGGLGIDLGSSGHTPNDPGDGDGGANGQQNCPTVDEATSEAGSSSVSGSITAEVNHTYTIELMADEGDSSGYGEGETLLDTFSLTTNGAGNASYSRTVDEVAVGKLVTATATDGNGNTSEHCGGFPPDPGDLGITKTAPEEAAVGEAFTYTIEVTNYGPGPKNFVTVTDDLPDGVTLQSYTITFNHENNFPKDAACTEQAGVVTCELFMLHEQPPTSEEALGAWRGTIELVVTASDPGCIQNQATAEGNGHEPVPDPHTNTAGTPDLCVGSSADLEVDKIAPAVASPGGDASFTVRVTNNGLDAAGPFEVTDQVPAGTTFVAASSSSDCEEDAGTVTCSSPGLANGAHVDWTLVFHLDESYACGTTLSNTAQISAAATADEVESNNSDTAVVNSVSCPATITVSKYEDRDADGIRDAGEPALNGWVFFLDADSDGVKDAGEAEETTAGAGQASFSVAPGSPYRVCEVLQADWGNTDPGGAAACETTAVLASGGQASLAFGNHSEIPDPGAVVLVCPPDSPDSVLFGGFTSDTEIRHFWERQNFMLTAPLEVDVTAPGRYDRTRRPPTTDPTIPALPVDVHMIHMDSSGARTLVGTVRFDAPILGLILQDGSDTFPDDTLHDSDFLGAIGTIYPTAVVKARGLEFHATSTDWVVLSADRLTLQMNLHVDGQTDEIRVITEATTDNLAPDAVDDTQVTNVGEGVDIDVLDNDSDPEGVTPEIMVFGELAPGEIAPEEFTQPANGTVTENPDGTLRYTPDAGFSGQDSFTYTITDCHGNYDTATVTVDVLSTSSTINVSKYEDLDADRARDAGEPDLNGWAFFLDADEDGVKDAGEAEQTTAGAGQASFSVASGASYRVCEVPQVNWLNTDPGGTAACETTPVLASGGQASLLFGNHSETPIPGAVVTVCPLPESVVLNEFTSDTEIRHFWERQNYMLTEPLDVDVTAPGLYDSVNTPPAPNQTIPPRAVDVHFIHMDNGSSGGATTLSGTVTFTAPILGLIVEDVTLDESDDLGAIGTTYPGAVPNRGLELVPTSPDHFILSADRMSVQVWMGVTGQTDQIRVITEATTDNLAPDAVDDTAVTDVGVGKDIDVLDNDSDPEGVAPEIVVPRTAPLDTAHGTVTRNPDNTLRYTPDAGFRGQDSFTYTITDCHGNYDTATVTVDVLSTLITVKKYEDLNGDGDRDADEPDLNGWAFFLDADEDGVKDAGEAEQTTAGTGQAQFDVTPGSSYRVCEVSQPDWVNSDPGGTAACEATAELASGDQATLEFGNYRFTSITVSKYEDLNGDGDRDQPVEPSLNDWVFFLDSDADGVKDAGEVEQTTAGTGQASFSVTPGSSYRVCEVLQADWVNSDPGGTTACEITAVLASGDEATLEFGNYRFTSITVSKYEDLNGDGDRDQPVEPSLNDWVFFLDSDADGVKDAGEVEQTTAGTGQASFSVTPGSSYRACEVLQADWVNSDPGGAAACEETAVLDSGDQVSLEFGNHRAPTITVSKYEDLNGDGNRDQPVEPPLNDWVFFLDGDADGVLDAGEAEQTTAGAGQVQFEVVPGSSYRVCEVLPATWRNSDPGGTAACEATAVLASGDQVSLEFGNYRPAAITVKKYEDRNADGSREAGEPDLNGWVFFLDADADGVRDAGEAQQTTPGSGQPSGQVKFDVIPGSSYRVCEVGQANWRNSDPGGAAACEATALLVSGDQVSLEFGNYRLPSIAGHKYEDPNADGTLSDGLPLANWTIRLYNATGTTLLQTTTTNADGEWGFTGLVPALYLVCEVMPNTTWSQSAPTGFTCGAIPGVAPGGFAVAATAGSSTTDLNFGNFQRPELTVSKSGPTAALLGAPFTYTVQVNNSGPGTARNVRVTDVLPSSLIFVPGAGPCTGPTGGGGTVTCDLQEVSVGTPKSVTITVRARLTCTIVGTPGDDQPNPAGQPNWPYSRMPTAAAETICGAAGSDVIPNGAGGNDTIFGLGPSGSVSNSATVASNPADRITTNNRSQVVTTTITPGVDGNDTIHGGPGNDVIFGNIGNDDLWGDEGADTIRGEAGVDEIYGDVGTSPTVTTNAGNDTLIGGTQGDVIYGQAGVDELLGEDGADTLHGGAGSDRTVDGRGGLFGGDGGDFMYGGPGNDTMNGNAGDDEMYGEEDGDVMGGGDGNDTMYGGAGHDDLHGGDNNDTMYGGTGNDRMNGNPGNDLMFGQAGGDLMEGASGDDEMYGGADDDELHGGTGTNDLDCGEGADRYSNGPAGEVHTNCETNTG